MFWFYYPVLWEDLREEPQSQRAYILLPPGVAGAAICVSRGNTALLTVAVAVAAMWTPSLL